LFLLALRVAAVMQMRGFSMTKFESVDVSVEGGDLPASYAVHAGSVFDGFTMSGPATVHVEDGKVFGVDRSGAIPAGKHVVDLGPGVCLMPGLVEAHMHLAFDASPQVVESLKAVDDDRLLDQMREAAHSAVLAGITTVRDLGDRNFLSLTLAEEFRKAPELGPEILAAGPPITTPGGHCYFMGGETQGTDALIAAVRERHERGCAVVKIMASGGNMTEGSDPGTTQYTAEEIRTVVEEAHRLGLPVAAHAHGLGAIIDAVNAGVDTAEHVTFFGRELKELDRDVLHRIAASNTHLSLTFGATLRIDQLPDALHDRVVKLNEIMRYMIGIGAKAVVGSDAGINPVKPHNVLPYAALALVECGMSPLQALQTLTSQAAKACRVEGRKGRIQAGADADFLAVHGNPLEDLNRLRDIRAVFRSGHRIR
jgi:imidazolonepropionase-like amidohydrolase